MSTRRNSSPRRKRAPQVPEPRRNTTISGNTEITYLSDTVSVCSPNLAVVGSKKDSAGKVVELSLQFDYVVSEKNKDGKQLLSAQALMRANLSLPTAKSVYELLGNHLRGAGVIKK